MFFLRLRHNSQFLLITKHQICFNRFDLQPRRRVGRAYQRGYKIGWFLQVGKVKTLDKTYTYYIQTNRQILRPYTKLYRLNCYSTNQTVETFLKIRYIVSLVFSLPSLLPTFSHWIRGHLWWVSLLIEPPTKRQLMNQIFKTKSVGWFVNCGRRFHLNVLVKIHIKKTPQAIDKRCISRSINFFLRFVSAYFN